MVVIDGVLEGVRGSLCSVSQRNVVGDISKGDRRC